MTYSKFIEYITPYTEEKYAKFHGGLTPTKYKILGIRMPIIRKLAKEYKGSLEELLSYPNEYYEVVSIKLAVVAALPYQEFIKYVPTCVDLIDNWAHCDGFKANCIAKYHAEFLSVLDEFFKEGSEFYQRFALVTLLHFYIDEKYLFIIEEYIKNANVSFYYVHMAVAWLIAEILIKYYDYGIKILKEKYLEAKTQNIAIQKAIESYRLKKEQKDYLRSLKIKNKKI